MWHREILLATVILCGCSSPPSPTTDAGIDASSEAAPASRFCASGQHVFCDDFDDPARTSTQGAWDTLQSSGTIAIDAQSYTSAPKSLSMTATSSSTLSQMQKNITTPPTAKRYTFSAMFEAVALTEQVRVFYLAGPFGIFEIDVASNDAFCAIGTGALSVYEAKQALSPPPIGQWMPIGLTIDLAGNNLTCTLGTSTTSIPITGMTPASYAELELFPYDPVQSTTTEIRFDDVVIDVQ
jgi:hypothetical protein